MLEHLVSKCSVIVGTLKSAKFDLALPHMAEFANDTP